MEDFGATKINSSRNRVLFLIAAVAQGIGAVIVQPFAVRIMPASEWGLVSFGLSLTAVSLVAITAGLPLAIGSMYFKPNSGRVDASAVNGFGSLLALSTGIIAAAILALIPLPNEPLRWILLLSLIAIAMHGVSQMNLAYLRSEGRALLFVLITVFATVLGHFAALGAMLLISPSAIVYLSSVAICVTLAAALGVKFSKPRSPRGHRTAVVKSIKISLPVLPHALALITMQQGLPILLLAFSGAVLVGKYNSLMPLAIGSVAFVLALGNVWQTVLFSLRGNHSHVRSKMIQSEAFLVIMAVVIAGSGVSQIATLILSNHPTTAMFQAAKILPLVASGYVGFLIASSQLFAIGKTRMMSWITPVIAVLMLMLAVSPATHGDIFLLSAIQVAAFITLGLAFMSATVKLVEMRIYLATMVGAVCFALINSLMPLNSIFMWVSAGSGLAIAALVVLITVRLNRRGIPSDGVTA